MSYYEVIIGYYGLFRVIMGYSGGIMGYSGLFWGFVVPFCGDDIRAGSCLRTGSTKEPTASPTFHNCKDFV